MARARGRGDDSVVAHAVAHVVLKPNWCVVSTAILTTTDDENDDGDEEEKSEEVTGKTRGGGARAGGSGVEGEVLFN